MRKKDNYQKPTKKYSSLEITSVVHKALQECEDFRNYRPDVYAARVGATVELLLNEQKPLEWSEEDGKMLDNICDNLRKFYVAKKGYPYIADEDSEEMKEQKWLKSLKPQSHWKPSEEQMNALELASRQIELYDCQEALESLLEDLKVL